MSSNAAAYPSRDCLVAVVNNDRDLERFARDRWYRIPERAIGRAIGEQTLEELRTLALYQTHTVSSGLPGAIELWGEVAEVEPRLRREIVPEEPDHPAADEPYRLIRLASVERLAAPIVSRRPRRVTFIRTTRGRLLTASEINDLFIGTPGEEALWRSLRASRRAAHHDALRGSREEAPAMLDVERRVFMTIGETTMEVDFAIHEGSRGLAVICEGASVAEPTLHDSDGAAADGQEDGGAGTAWLILRFSPAELEVEMERCLEEIHELLDRMRREGIAG